MWWGVFLIKPFLLSPEGSHFVNKTGQFSPVLKYTIPHPSLDTTSQKIFYRMIWYLLFGVESGMDLLHNPDLLSPIIYTVYSHGILVILSL